MEKTYLVNACSCWGKGETLSEALENWVMEVTSALRSRPAQEAQLEVIIITCEPSKVLIGGLGFDFPPGALTYSRLMDMPDYRHVLACGDAMRAFEDAMRAFEDAMVDMSENIQCLIDEMEAECDL